MQFAQPQRRIRVGEETAFGAVTLGPLPRPRWAGRSCRPRPTVDDPDEGAIHSRPRGEMATPGQRAHGPVRWHAIEFPSLAKTVPEKLNCDYAMFLPPFLLSCS